MAILQNLYRQFSEKRQSSASFSGIEKILRKQMGLSRAVFAIRSGKTLKTTCGKSPFSPSVQKTVFAHLNHFRPWICPKESRSGWSGFWPIVIGRDWVGCFALGRRYPSRDFSGEEKKLMELLVDRTAFYLERRQLKEQLEKADRQSSLGLRSDAIIHEIRSPLTALSTLVQLWPEKKNDDGFMRSFQPLMLREINRLTDMTKTFFSFTSRGPKEKTRIDFFRVVAESERLLAPLFEIKRIRLRVRNTPRLFLKGREQQLESLILNLSHNALESTVAGGSVEISTALLSRAAYGPGRWIELKVKDNGTGISKDRLKKVFDPYFSTKGRGTGLGLAICQRVMENHRGKITARSSKAGTVFQAFLPAE